jgi:hypothetical protein
LKTQTAVPDPKFWRFLFFRRKFCHAVLDLFGDTRRQKGGKKRENLHRLASVKVLYISQSIGHGDGRIIAGIAGTIFFVFAMLQQKMAPTRKFFI